MPRKSNNNNLILWIIVAVLIIAGIITLISAFNSGGDDGLDTVNASYTSAAETLSAQQLTLQSSASATPTIALSTPTIALTPTVFASPTLFVATLASPTTSTIGSGAVGCDNSVYIADVTIPDNTAMTPGQTFKKTWKLQNTGTCPWTTSYKVTFLSGNQMNGVAEPITVEVPAGQSADVSVNMTAPTTIGDAKGTWILTNANGVQFGTTFYVLIKVGAATTGTATATSTSGAPVPSATFTVAPSTAVPSETPSITPTTPSP